MTEDFARQYWYETQERAFAPRIADGWPPVIAAPHTKNGRLVRRNGDPSELLAALKAMEETAMRLGLSRKEEGSAEADQEWADALLAHFAALKLARAAIAKAEGQ